MGVYKRGAAGDIESVDGTWTRRPRVTPYAVACRWRSPCLCGKIPHMSYGSIGTGWIGCAPPTLSGSVF